VHHRNYPSVLDTISALTRGGIRADRLVVIDNSEAPDVARALERSLPQGAVFRTVPNHGYGAAVNYGVSLIDSGTFVLVATHETLAEPDAITELYRALKADCSLAAVGPTLVTEGTNELVTWSHGGVLTRSLRIPQHVDHLEPAAAVPPPPLPVPRAWLDGAFVMYRLSVLREFRMDESFFLYFEETDLHCRLARADWGISWIPSAVVRQSSGGTPPYYRGRNLYMFQRRNGSVLGRYFAVPHEIARYCLGRVVRRQAPVEALNMLRGWVDGLRR
jgi:N-acetylglucosaminyl-diphospho-decaprenol L-rhamnosyltransferase